MDWLRIFMLSTSISIANFLLAMHGDSPCGLGIGEFAGVEIGVEFISIFSPGSGR
ncbi:hypothetical protein NPIL_351441, partial [Nephila pilipes]